MGPKESAPASQSLTSYRFGDRTLDPARRTVRRSDTNIQLGKLTYDLLCRNVRPFGTIQYGESGSNGALERDKL